MSHRLRATLSILFSLTILSGCAPPRILSRPAPEFPAPPQRLRPPDLEAVRVDDVLELDIKADTAGGGLPLARNAGVGLVVSGSESGLGSLERVREDTLFHFLKRGVSIADVSAMSSIRVRYAEQRERSGQSVEWAGSLDDMVRYADVVRPRYVLYLRVRDAARVDRRVQLPWIVTEESRAAYVADQKRLASEAEESLAALTRLQKEEAEAFARDRDKYGRELAARSGWDRFWTHAYLGLVDEGDAARATRRHEEFVRAAEVLRGTIRRVAAAPPVDAWESAMAARPKEAAVTLATAEIVAQLLRVNDGSMIWQGVLRKQDESVETAYITVLDWVVDAVFGSGPSPRPPLRGGRR